MFAITFLHFSFRKLSLICKVSVVKTLALPILMQVFILCYHNLQIAILKVLNLVSLSLYGIEKGIKLNKRCLLMIMKEAV